MTHDKFWDLYNNGEIQVKVWDGEIDGVQKSVEAFEYDGKFFLRIHSVYRYVTGERKFGKRYRMSKESHFIKEFNSKEHANAYFKKAAQGLKKVR